MKKLLLLQFIAVLLLSTNFHAQSGGGQLRGGELVIDFVNRPANWELTVKIEAVGIVWNQFHNITIEYLGGDTTYSSTTYPVPIFHASDLEWDFIGYEPVLSLGLYKVSIWEGQNERVWFYINYRTSYLPQPSNSGNIDVLLDYDLTTKELELTNPNLGHVVNGSYYPIWELKSSVNHLSEGLEDYWDNCLAVIPDADNHLRLVWGPYPDNNFEVINYKIYRKIDQGNWVLIGTVNSYTFSYIDGEIVTGNKRGVVKYYRKAYDGTTETDPTNTVTGFYEQYNPNKVGTTKLIDKQRDYSLSQNYPNPFNPSTIITWQSPIDDVVTLKVIDVLGREVATLVNERREAGIHSVEFNASYLPSGVYLYSIQIGNYMETRKLILQK
jgi:Secretion system C-terminal sorting domain